MLKRRHSLVLHVLMMTATGSLLAALALLSACGQKGPLVLRAPSPATAAAPSASPASSPASLAK
jgi:predicted small lipoprotein YifL